MDRLISRASDTVSLWMACARLCSDSQGVVAMRLMGMSGAWSMPRGETQAMLDEKAPAFTEAMVAGTISALSGHPPEKVGHATIEPLSSRARNNHERLIKCGPSWLRNEF